MRTSISRIVGALLGVTFCLLVLQLFNQFGAIPNFPAYGGEHDFNLRAAWFVLAVIPGFLLVGAWLGVLLARSRKTGLYALAGALAGTLAYMTVLLVLRSTVEGLSSQSANLGAILAELAWVMFTVVGVLIGVTISRRPSVT